MLLIKTKAGLLRLARNGNYAFTLAEVLITLGIIGIVAALTLPNLIADHRKQAYQAGLKKAYSILSQVYAEAIFDNDINSSNEFLSLNNKFGLNLYSVIKQYFDLGVNCESTNCLNLNTMNSMKLYKKYNNSSIGYHSWFDYGQFI